MLFYDKIVPLDKNSRTKINLSPIRTYEYAEKTSIIPITAIEFAHAAGDYPIAFVRDENGTVTAVVVVGIREGENLIVDADGNWTADYVPAYVRRYPFILGSMAGKKNPVLCLDAAAVVEQDEEGEPLFEKNGKPGQYLQSMMDLASDYQAQVALTSTMIELLEKYDLLKSVSVTLETAAGSLTVNGLEVVAEDRLQALTESQVYSLFDKGLLLAVYAHLISQKNFAGLAARVPGE